VVALSHEIFRGKTWNRNTHVSGSLLFLQYMECSLSATLTRKVVRQIGNGICLC
jgi:hypothetical protein